MVTAAHCVRRKLYVRLGEHDLRDDGEGAFEVEMKVSEHEEEEEEEEEE